MMGTGCRCCFKPTLVVWLTSSVTSNPGLYWEPKFLGLEFTPCNGNATNLIVGYNAFPGLYVLPPGLQVATGGYSVHQSRALELGLWSGSVTVDLHAVWWSPPGGSSGFACCGSGPVSISANIFWSRQTNVLIDAFENPALRQSITVSPATFTDLDQASCVTPRVGSITVSEDASFTVNNLP